MSDENNTPEGGNINHGNIAPIAIQDEMETLDIDYQWQFDIYDKFIKNI